MDIDRLFQVLKFIPPSAPHDSWKCDRGSLHFLHEVLQLLEVPVMHPATWWAWHSLGEALSPLPGVIG
eukprot:Skav201387  [mRNA]  locus=scaffold3514:300524:300727:- [translate_table: standard]